MREIEIEFKNLLSEEQYLTLFKKYDLKNSEEIINKNYISDKNNIFYKDKILENIDRSTFEIMDEVNSRDINGNYIDRCYNIFNEYCNEEYTPEIY